MRRFSSSSRSVSQSVGRFALNKSVSRFYGRSVSKSVSRFYGRSVSKSVSRFYGRSVSKSMSRFMRISCELVCGDSSLSR